MVGLLLAEAYPGRWSRRLSALTTAHCLRFSAPGRAFPSRTGAGDPPGARAEAESELETGLSSLTRLARILLGWASLAAVLVALAFVPLFLAGLFGDFVRSIGVTYYGSGYNKASSGSILKQMLLQVLHLDFDLVPLAILVLVSVAKPPTGASAWVWLLAYLGAWFYKPLSPVPFPYLENPLAARLGHQHGGPAWSSVWHPGRNRRSDWPRYCWQRDSGCAPSPRVQRRLCPRASRLCAGECPCAAPAGDPHRRSPPIPRQLAFPWNDYRRDPRPI